MTEITELLEKVKAATGPDRELDGEIALALGFPPADLTRREDGWLWYKFIEPDDFDTWVAPPYTASIDAALALTERVLPGAEMHITLNHPKNDWQTASIRVAPLKLVSGEETTPPLAILAALFSALSTQADK